MIQLQLTNLVKIKALWTDFTKNESLKELGHLKTSMLSLFKFQFQIISLQ